MAEETTQVVLDIGLKEADESLEAMMDGMETLQDLAKDIGAELRKAFAPLQTMLQKTISQMGDITGILTEATASVQKLMEQMASEQVADQWLGGVSTAVNALSVFSSVMKQIKDETFSVNQISDVLKKSIGGVIAELQKTEVWSALTNSFDGVIVKIKEVIATWGGMTAVKDLDKAADENFIARCVEGVKQFAKMIAQLVSSTAAVVANTAAKVASTAAEWAHIAAMTAWNAICATATAVTTAFNAALSVLTSPITLVIAGIAALVATVVLLVKNWDTVAAAAVRVWETIKQTFGDAWSWFKIKVIDPMLNGIKGGVNGIIGFINGLIAGVVNGFNSIINVINKLQFTIPDWIPGFGGQAFGFSFKTVTAPQIPYLAKGAVLPANKPFLAMVGDQRYGTNIEAPLATIQEAMAMTMEDFVASNMAGHQATVGVLSEILEAVLGIHIGDAEIARAAERYQRKMAVVNGRAY